MSIPAFGLGTFRLQDQVVIDSVSTALELGYRAIDTAQIYENEAAVGQAIAASGVPRDELFITTKIWIANLARGINSQPARQLGQTADLVCRSDIDSLAIAKR